MNKIETLLTNEGIDFSNMNDEEKFRAASKLTFYEETLAADDWNIPGGVLSVSSEQNNENIPEEQEEQNSIIIQIDESTNIKVIEENSEGYSFTAREYTVTPSDYQNDVIITVNDQEYTEGMMLPAGNYTITYTLIVDDKVISKSYQTEISINTGLPHIYEIDKFDLNHDGVVDICDLAVWSLTIMGKLDYDTTILDINGVIDENGYMHPDGLWDIADSQVAINLINRHEDLIIDDPSKLNTKYFDYPKITTVIYNCMNAIGHYPNLDELTEYIESL